MDINGLKDNISKIIQDDKQELFSISQYIYDNPEMNFKEYKACKVLTEYLEKSGFNLTKNAGGLDTAFTAEYCPTGIKYPVIAILAEYDALSIGHACGHNIIATTAVGAGMALKQVMDQQNIKGTLRVIGTPAEEGGGGKIIMQKHGVFDDVDSMFLLHPTSGVTKIAGNCRSSYKLIVEYHGKAAHASSHPDKGINAVDAAHICYTALSCLRQQVISGISIMPLILNGGTENGLVPDYSKLVINIRGFNLKSMMDTVGKIKNCAKAGAVATGCTVDIKEIPGYYGRVKSQILGNVCRKNFELLGEPLMDGMVDDNGGEDFGNLNRVIPGVMVYPTLLPEEKISNHTERFKELANSPKSRDVIILGSEVMAYSALDLFNDTSIIDAAKEELKELQKTF